MKKIILGMTLTLSVVLPLTSMASEGLSRNIEMKNPSSQEIQNVVASGECLVDTHADPASEGMGSMDRGKNYLIIKNLDVNCYQQLNVEMTETYPSLENRLSIEDYWKVKSNLEASLKLRTEAAALTLSGHTCSSEIEQKVIERISKDLSRVCN